MAADKPDDVKEAFYADCSASDIALSTENVVAINTSIPNIYQPTTRAAIERHYIECTEDRAIPNNAQHEMIAEFPGTQVHTLKSSHSPFYSQPDDLANILDGIA